MSVQTRVPPNHLIPPSSVFDDAMLRDLAREFATPLFVYDFQLLSTALDELRSILPEDCEVLYSVKANPSLAVLRHFSELGVGFEVASIGELIALENARIDCGLAVFVGPGKRPAELAAALERGLGWLVLDSPLEYERALRVRAALGCKSSLALRLNPGVGRSRGGMLRMGGQTPFGMTEQEALGLLRQTSDEWPIEGFHGYLGTRILEAETIVANTALLLGHASRLQQQSGARFRFVDLGGGFGIPQYDRDSELDARVLKSRLEDLVGEFRREHPWTEVIAFESGRFLSARAGVFLCSVIDCKERDGELFVVLDGGISSVGGRDGYAGARPMPLRLLADAEEVVSATFCGPLCTPMDRVATRLLVPRPEPGQLVAMFLAGAYAYSASAGLFLSHGYCAEVGVNQGKARLLRPRQDINVLVNLQSL